MIINRTQQNRENGLSESMGNFKNDYIGTLNTSTKSSKGYEFLLDICYKMNYLIKTDE